MATREQVRQLLDGGLDYRAAARELRIPAGQAYMIATGVPRRRQRLDSRRGNGPA